MKLGSRARTFLVCAWGGVALAASGCATDVSESDATTDESTSSTIEPIIQGVETTAYPEAALLTMQATAGGSFACSAVLIAPRVILTAGHCVDGMSSWDVTVGSVRETSITGKTYDWHEATTTSVNPAHHDIGLVILDKPIALATYPTLAAGPAADGTQLIDVGRIDNGVLTNAFYKAPVKVASGSTVGYAFDYVGTDVIEHGDSGGPVFMPTGHTIAGINSGANGTLEVLSRVDLLNSWISQQIAAAGGMTIPTQDAGRADAAPLAPPADAGTAHAPDAAPAGSTATPPAGSAPGAPDAGSASKAPDAGACVAEHEPNDTLSQANVLSDRECGALSSATDVDWYEVSAAPGTTRIALSASGDAALAVGYITPQKTCSVVIPQSAGATGATITVGKAAAAVPVCITVASRAKKVQSYTLTVTRGS